MNKHIPTPFLLAACSVPVDGAAQRIQLIPAGEFRANDGRPVDAPFWRLSPQRAAALVAELNARPVRLMVDYEHQTLFTAQNGQPNPASGWLSGFEWVDGKGLYAEVQWTAAAKQRIAGGEYRYISPVFQYTPAGDILSLLPPALTNTPALDQLDPVALAAASRLLNPLQPMQKENAMNEAQKLMLSLLGLPETASEAEQLAAMQQIQSSTDGKKLAEALAAAKEAAKPENKPAEPNPPAAPAAPAGQPANDETGAPNTAAASQQVPLSALQGLQRQVAALSQQLAAHEAEKTAQLITAAGAKGMGGKLGQNQPAGAGRIFGHGAAFGRPKRHADRRHPACCRGKRPDCRRGKGGGDAGHQRRRLRKTKTGVSSHDYYPGRP